MPFGLGFFSTAGVSAAAGSFDLLETQVLGSTSSAVTFSSLSQYATDYRHLQIRYTGRSNRASAYSTASYRFNGVSTMSYAVHILDGQGSGSPRSASATSYFGYLTEFLPAANTTANVFGAGVIDILDAFSTNKNKVV